MKTGRAKILCVDIFSANKRMKCYCKQIKNNLYGNFLFSKGQIYIA